MRSLKMGLMKFEGLNIKGGGGALKGWTTVSG